MNRSKRRQTRGNIEDIYSVFR